MIEFSVALVFVALIVRDCFRHWVKHVDMQTFQGNQIELLKSAIAQLQDRGDERAVEQAELVKKLAEDWARKFKQIETDNAALQRHIDSQVAGTIAQLPATGRGFGR